jgi:hypothetical protein
MLALTFLRCSIALGKIEKLLRLRAKRLFRSMEWAKSAEAMPQTLEELQRELPAEKEQ